MYTHRAYGLNIQSDFSLTGIPPAGEGPIDVYIRFCDLDESSLAEEPRRAGRFFGTIYDDLVVLIEDGSRISIDVRSDIDESGIWVYVTGVLMAILLRQRGMLAIHACGVAKDDMAIGFVGESGWGKSTLAEYFCSRGYTLVNDDILAVQLPENSEPVVVPGYPQIRLKATAGEKLRKDFSMLPEVFPGTNKRISDASDFADGPISLKRLFLLNLEFTDQASVELCKPKDALFRLLAHTRVTHLFKDSQSLEDHFSQCATLTNLVPILHLHRERSLDALSEIFDVVEKELSVDR